MLNLSVKIMFISLISIAFLHAENMPQDLESIIKSIKSSNLYYDKVSSFDDKQIIAPLDFKRLSYNNENELLQAIKTTTDDNRTYQNKLSKLKKENNDFCSVFFDDLNNFKNIKIKEPISKNVPYGDEKFKKTMGYCYDMGMDLFFNVYRYDGIESSPRTDNMIKPISYTLYKTNLLGENNLLLFQNYHDPKYVPNPKPIQILKAGYILNNDMCKSALKDDFDILKDRKILSKTAGINPDNDGVYYDIINYKGKDYIFVAINLFDFVKIYLEHDFPNNPVDNYDFDNVKCLRTIFFDKENRDLLFNKRRTQWLH